MLRFIALTILAYFIFRWLDRLLGPRPAPSRGRSSRSQSNAAPTKSKVKKNVGEYIDYEEVKDADTSEKSS